MSTEIIRTVRDGEPRTATSTFTHLLNSDQFKFNVALRPQRPCGLLCFSKPAQDVSLDFHTALDLSDNPNHNPEQRLILGWPINGRSREVTRRLTERRSCMKVEVAVLGSPSLTVLMTSVDVKQH